MTGGDKPGLKQDIGPDVRMIGQLAAASLLARTQAAHLDAESLAAFADNALSRGERERALAHLAECSECREVMFLAQPQMTEVQLALIPSRPRGAVMFRWAALACAFAIVAGGAFLAKHELGNRQSLSARQQPAPLAGYTNTVEEKASRPQSSAAPAIANITTRTEIQANGRPNPKHMTAKPQEKMQFDSSDQVHIFNAQASNLRVQGQNEAGLRDLATAAPPANVPIEANKIQTTTHPPVVTEMVTVEVTGENPSVNAQTGVAVAKTTPTSQSVNGAAVGGIYKALQNPVAQWEISAAGALQRSFDQGKTWQEVAVNGARAGFLATYSSGPQVWVGGSAGLLYHSADSGLTWMRVTPSSGERKLNSDIVHIEFTDEQNGRFSVKGGESWTTSDGGQTWTPQH